MSFSTVIRDIEARLLSNWGTTDIDINPNIGFSVPETDTPWIRLRVFNESNNRITIGNPGTYRQTGTLTIQIYTPLNQGTRLGLSYGDTLAAIWRDQQFNGITMREANVLDIGEADGWWQTNLLVPFFWDARHLV